MILKTRPITLKLCICLSLCLWVSACGSTDTPMGKPLPELTYSNLNPYSVRGGSIIVRESHKEKQLHQTSDFVIPPGELLKRYADNRFYTEGVPQRMVFDIRKAKVEHKTKETGMMGFVSGSDKDLYYLDILIVMSLLKPDGSLNKPYTISVQRKLEVSQNASIAQREFAQFEFLEKAMTDIDRAVTDIVIEKLQ